MYMKKRINSMLALLFIGGASLMAQTSDPFPDVDDGMYEEFMISTGQVRMNGEALPDGTIVAVYSDDEIRGKGVVQSALNRPHIFNFNIYGDDEDEPLHFKVFTDGRIIEVDQGDIFDSSENLGTINGYYYIDLPSPIVTKPSTEGWATTCLPFNAEVPEGVTAWYATGIENGELVLAEAAGKTLPKDTPVLLESTGLTSYEWLSRVADGDVSTKGSILKGTTEATTVEAGSVLTLGHNNTTGDIGFWLFTGTTIPANRAYIDEFPEGTSGARITGTTTGISQPEAYSNYTPQGTYTLSGQRLSTPPASGGIYVRHGKKVIIK